MLTRKKMAATAGIQPTFQHQFGHRLPNQTGINFTGQRTYGPGWQTHC